MSFRLNDEKLLEKYKTLWSKIKDLKNIEICTLPVYDDRYIKIKIGKHVDNVCTNFLGLNILEDDTECESFTVISIDSLFVYENKYCLQVYWDNGDYKITDKQMIDCVGENRFETDED